MEQTPRDLSFLVFIASIVFLIVSIGTYVYFETNTTFKIKDMGEPVQKAYAETPIEDIFPLYAGLQWNSPESVMTTLDDLTFHTFQISAYPLKHIVDVKRAIDPFSQYYDVKLKALGWVDGSAKTQGPASSQWTYKKDKKYIILSYVYEQEAPYRGGKIKCPCTVNFNIVTGGNE